ncbi:hypothetical protein JAAARDRAFT_198696 [Jaapia argillacea MUCL 33604]|uniref:Uncharacterized protein n=1 Tax=Jaapia argillacea MUCL 33604 TaxID=933084 RepID=A0A067PNY6_9AGAM|nr:hypothetical protein JAAARDRAFT_198696 [Jaapia argillacea MUCL 33604]
MGQRHQIFAIARVRRHGVPPDAPPAYRCVAAFHHQWSYGRLPARAMHRLLTLLKQPFNAEVVRAELRAIDGQYGGWRESPSIPDIPCPFVTALVGTAWCVDLEDVKHPYGTGSLSGSALSAAMGSAEGDNNDGISVVDVTDPLSPSYCFVNIGGMESEVDTDHWVPLSAMGYVRAYYPDPSSSGPQLEGDEAKRAQQQEQSVRATINLLEGEPLIDLSALAEAWPMEYADVFEESEADAGSEKEVPRVAAAIPSLTDMSFGPAVKYALETEDLSEIEAMIWMPGKAALVKSILKGHQPFPDVALSILAKVMEFDSRSKTGCWDLTDISLTSDQITRLVLMATHPIASLNISFNPHVTAETVRQILSSSPSIHRLVLMSCPALPAADLNSLLSTSPQLFSNLEALVHRAFLCIWSEDEDDADTSTYPAAFTLVKNRLDSQSLQSWSLPLLSPSVIVQNLNDYLQTIVEAEGSQYDDGMAPLAAISGGLRREGEPWGKRSIVGVPGGSLEWANGEGWVFVFPYGESYGQNPVPQSWGFVKFRKGALNEAIELKATQAEAKSDDVATGEDPAIQKAPEAAKPSGEPACEVHDLRSFLAIVCKEKPPPSEESIAKLEATLSKLTTEKATPLMSASHGDALLKLAMSFGFY